jgi:hypothetical protein
MNTYIYIHVCCMNQWRDVFANLIYRIKESGLYDEVKGIRCGVVGRFGDATIFDDRKIEIAHSGNVKLYETSTLNLLHEHARQEDFDVLYLHTKGVSHRPGTRRHAHVVDWVNYLCYFNIHQHATCRKHLHTHDAAGVNLQGAEPGNCLHYSGNFWWSKAAYIRTLNRCVHSSHNAPEFWLTESRAGSYLSLWTSGVNHYDQPYPPDRYIGRAVSSETRTSWPPNRPVNERHE